MSAFSALLARDFGEEETTCNFHWVKARLNPRTACRPITDARFTRFLKDLIRDEGFPKPLPHAKHGGGIERGVTPRSVWLRPAIIEWLTDYLPPRAAEMIDAKTRHAAAREMDHAALSLVGGTAANLPEERKRA